MSRATCVLMTLVLLLGLGGRPGWAEARAGLGDAAGEMDVRHRLLRMLKRRVGTARTPARAVSRRATVARVSKRSSRAERTRIVGHLMDEWRMLGLSVEVQAALLSVGWSESRLNLAAISADGLPDDRVGKSWGLFQFAQTTLRGLGITFAALSPRRAADGTVAHDELERAARASARAAVKFLMTRAKRSSREPWLSHTQQRTGGDDEAMAREIFVIWSSGHGRRWADVVARARQHPEEKRQIGSLGYVYTQVQRRMKLYRRVFRPWVRRLALQGSAST